MIERQPDGSLHKDGTPVSWNWVIAVAEDHGLDTDAIYDEEGDEGIRRALNESLAD